MSMFSYPLCLAERITDRKTKELQTQRVTYYCVIINDNAVPEVEEAKSIIQYNSCAAA